MPNAADASPVVTYGRFPTPSRSFESASLPRRPIGIMYCVYDNNAPWTLDTFEPIRDAVALLAADAATQTRFVEDGPIRLPVSEIYENLSDVVPSWLPRMVSDHVISVDLAMRLETFQRYLDGLPDDVWRDQLSVFTSAAWAEIRSEAAQLLFAIDAEFEPSAIKEP